MKFILTQTSDYDKHETIKIESINDLIDLINKKGDIVMGENVCYPDNNEPKYFIEIYDNYRE